MSWRHNKGDSKVSKPIHIGQILIEHGVLSEQQVFEVLQAQREQHKPFGVLAERMFDVTLQSMERAWVDQYCRITGEMDLSQEQIDPRVLHTINRRQAWQFEMMPLHYEPGGELVVAASDRRLARAVTFAANRLESVVYFRVVPAKQLREYLMKHYPMPQAPQNLIEQAMEMTWLPPRAESA